jgi:hypothetical protein
MPQISPSSQTQCLEEMLQRIAGDLSMIADREYRLDSVASAVTEARPAGASRVHIAFRFGVVVDDARHHGCLLVPLPDAIGLACSLMMVPDDVLAASRGQTKLDEPTKDALLEVGNFVSGAAAAALEVLGKPGMQVVFEGCQGVKPDVRPALIYREGDALLVARAQATLGDFEPGDVILMLPAAAV